ncbi:phage virion morphogenesis protein [Azonexus sp. R2A61]|uniref:phage virion morphogenesis protein n=1 Tax=Azonexus sp. R2A61 TaxID=2744443 RepID=UPI001F2038F5|nr:phage virion morphogenesis protein [Azonexus sp. R2A61]
MATTITPKVGADKFRQLAANLEKPASLFIEVAGMLESETEENFASQGRPDWIPLADSTKRSRLKRNNGSSLLQILQDRGILGASVAGDSGDDWAMISAGGAASDYALIQQVGGTIERAPYSTKTRLRTDAKGNLLRQPKDKRLAVFASDSHKRVRESWSEVGPYSVDIPARPYLPFYGSVEDATLQPQAEVKLIAIAIRFLEAPFA